VVIHTAEDSCVGGFCVTRVKRQANGGVGCPLLQSCLGDLLLLLLLHVHVYGRLLVHCCEENVHDDMEEEVREREGGK
jgi:hypothetical protein